MKTAVNKGLVLPETPCDTVCPWEHAAPDSLHFLLSGQKGTQSCFLHLHNVKKMSHIVLSFVEKYWQEVPIVVEVESLKGCKHCA